MYRRRRRRRNILTSLSSSAAAGFPVRVEGNAGGREGSCVCVWKKKVRYRWATKRNISFDSRAQHIIPSSSSSFFFFSFSFFFIISLKDITNIILSPSLSSFSSCFVFSFFLCTCCTHAIIIKQQEGETPLLFLPSFLPPTTTTTLGPMCVCVCGDSSVWAYHLHLPFSSSSSTPVFLFFFFCGGVVDVVVVVLLHCAHKSHTIFHVCITAYTHRHKWYSRKWKPQKSGLESVSTTTSRKL